MAVAHYGHAMNKPSQLKPRVKYLKVMVTSDEKLKFQRLATSRGTDISELIRQLLHKEAA